MSLLTVGLSVALLGGVLGKLAVDRRIHWQPAGDNSAVANSTSVDINNPQAGVENDEIPAQSPATHWWSTITFPEALQIAEAAIGSKAYSIERESESGKPVIEVGIDGQEVFVDAESGKIVLIDNLRQKGDPEDIAEVTAALKLQPLASVTVQAALQAGERHAGAPAHSVNLENADGNLVYVVVVELQKVFIDAGNGKVLSTKAVEPDEEDDELNVNSSIQVPDDDEP